MTSIDGPRPEAATLEAPAQVSDAFPITWIVDWPVEGKVQRVQLTCESDLYAPHEPTRMLLALKGYGITTLRQLQASLEASQFRAGHSSPGGHPRMNEAEIRGVVREELKVLVPELATAVAEAMAETRRVRRAKDLEWRSSLIDPSYRYVSPRQRQSSRTLPEQ